MGDKSKIGYEIGFKYLGPVVFSYIKWVLDKALEKDIKCLYFMARDGWLMYKCALKLKAEYKKYGEIKTEYFYASRMSLRLPSYYITDFEEAVDSILIKEYNDSPLNFFKKIKLNDEEIDKICRDICLKKENANKIIYDKEIEDLRKKLIGSCVFKQILNEKSERAYRQIKLYIEKTGMLNGEKFAVVDSGWTGSVQKSLLKIIDSMGFKGTLTGFYFGLCKCRDTARLEYFPYYFTEKGGATRKAYFNANVFELLCSAEHGMTMGYEEDESEGIKPVFGKCEFCREKHEIQEGALDKIQLAENGEIDEIIKGLMHKPEEKYVSYLKNVRFSNSVTDDNMKNLVEDLTPKDAYNYILPVYLLNKALNNSKGKRRLFWEEGSIINSKVPFKSFLLFNVCLIKMIRYR